MKELLALAVVGVLAFAGCSQDEPAPASSDVTVRVSDTVGIAAPDVTVIATKRISDSQVEQIAESKTDGNGIATLTLPENATAAIGLWKDQGENEPHYTWQTPFVVPIDNTTLSYSYGIIANNCPVIQPGPTPCPTPSAPPAPSSTVSPTE